MMSWVRKSTLTC